MVAEKINLACWPQIWFLAIGAIVSCYDPAAVYLYTEVLQCPIYQNNVLLDANCFR